MKKLWLISFSAALVLMLTACGGTNTGGHTENNGGTGSAPATPSSVAGSASGSSDPYGGDIGYSGLLAALEEQGKIKVKAKYATTEVDGSTGSDSMESTFYFSEIALGNVQIDGSAVTADFTAALKNEKSGKYIEEQQRIIATLQKDSAGNYTFSSARTEGDIPIVVKPITPFSVDLLYEGDFVLAYACSNEALEAQRERILFNNSITFEDKTLRTDIENEIFVPINRENIKSIEVLPYGKDDKAIQGSDFELWADFKFTLQNDVVVYDKENIKLTGGKRGFDSGKGFRYASKRVDNL